MQQQNQVKLQTVFFVVTNYKCITKILPYDSQYAKLNKNTKL